MKNVRANARFWIAGTLVALAGVASARFVAPSFEHALRLVFTVASQLLALGGLFIICLGIRRRIQSARSCADSSPPPN